MKRFQCQQCGVIISKDLIPGELLTRPGKNMVKAGTFAAFKGAIPTYDDNLAMNPDDLIPNKWRMHTDPSRLNGCCHYAGDNGPNVICFNGHEIGILSNDCWCQKVFIVTGANLVDV